MADSILSSVNTPQQDHAGSNIDRTASSSANFARTPQAHPTLESTGSNAVQLSREAVADFVLRHEGSIRTIARRKLTQVTRGTFDSEDVMASVLRRMDKLAMDGALRPRSEAELWALIQTIVSNTAVSKTRLIERARILLTEDGAYAYEMLQRLNSCQTDDEAQLLVLRMAGALKSERSRQIFLLRVRGAKHAAIAGMLNMSEGACRQQWTQMCNELRAIFAEGFFHA